LKEAVSDYKDNNLINACILQFPYGRGGMHDLRYNKDGIITNNIDILEYIKYLSMISQPQFHTELFTLILYNIYMKQMMVRTASWKVRNKTDINMLANEICIDDVNMAIDASRYARGSNDENTIKGRKLLGAIDTICKSVPHTNEAARYAKRNAESLQHHFGCPTFFLTVTPDDDNNIIIQILSNDIIDDRTEVHKLSDNELLERAKKRTKLRIKYPGICALFFEDILNIIIKDVIGWNLETNTPMDHNGLFGKVTALSVSIEEQGRRTLHAHILIWVNELNNIRSQLYSTQRAVQRKAAATITKIIDKIVSTKCFFNNTINKQEKHASKAFPHECLQQPASRQKPSVVNDQELRYLRYKRNHDNAFCRCPHCPKTWTNQELLNSYLYNHIEIGGFSGLPDEEVRRLKAMAIQYQKNKDESNIPSFIIDAAYNNHCHTASCFKINKDDKVCTHSTEYTECRYRYPQRKKLRTTIQDVSDKKNSLVLLAWFIC
jgi:hypothetical protein